jgi:hypothetical protein
MLPSTKEELALQECVGGDVKQLGWAPIGGCGDRGSNSSCGSDDVGSGNGGSGNGSCGGDNGGSGDSNGTGKDSC